jgi:hypothetical protein
VKSWEGGLRERANSESVPRGFASSHRGGKNYCDPGLRSSPPKRNFGKELKYENTIDSRSRGAHRRRVRSTKEGREAS